MKILALFLCFILLCFIVSCEQISCQNARSLFMMGEIDSELNGEWLLLQSAGILSQTTNKHSQLLFKKNAMVTCSHDKDEDALIVKIDMAMPDLMKRFGNIELSGRSIEETGSGIKFLILIPVNNKSFNDEHINNTYACIIPYRLVNDDTVHILGHDLEKIIKDNNLPFIRHPPPSNISPFRSISFGELERDDLRKWAEALKQTTPMFVFNRRNMGEKAP